MLLGHHLSLKTDMEPSWHGDTSGDAAAPASPERMKLAAVWQHREKIEREAAAQFRLLAHDLREAKVPAALVSLANRAAGEETDHATLCRCIVDHLAPGLAVLPPMPVVALGPVDLPLARRALFASVALSCVTETLSTALLLEMLRLASDPLVEATVRRILRDEISHSRLGWAHLAWIAERDDVSWLTPHLPGMLRAALVVDVSHRPLGDDAHHGDAHGVLSASRIRAIAAAAITDVVIPGMARYGVDASRLSVVISGVVPAAKP